MQLILIHGNTWNLRNVRCFNRWRRGVAEDCALRSLRGVVLTESFMTNAELIKLAEGWIAYWTAPADSPERELFSWVWDQEYYLMQNEPEQMWRLILEILQRNSSSKIQEVLSAGPLEDLLAKHGESIIEKVEAEARSNPIFARLIGGVWKSSMSEAIWTRVQSVWDRRGWDGNPES